MSKSLPIIEDPEAEHARLDKSIREKLKRLERKESQLNLYVEFAFETRSKWHELSVGTKLVLDQRLDEWIHIREGEQAA
jgi:hypothetical protein